MSRFQQSLMRFMSGRRGADELGFALIILMLILNVVSMFFGGIILSLISTVVFIYAMFRMLSRNIAKRDAENRWFLGWWTPIHTKIKQARVRFKNRKIYKYYRCPKCKSWLKLPRNIGEKQVTCGHCGASFTKKA